MYSQWAWTDEQVTGSWRTHYYPIAFPSKCWLTLITSGNGSTTTSLSSGTLTQYTWQMITGTTGGVITLHIGV